MAAMAASQPRLVVLDTNLLLDMAEQHAASRNVALRLVRNGEIPIVVQTVVQELGYASQDTSKPRVQALAVIALTSMRLWGVQPVALKPVGNGICEVIADKIAYRRILPPEERNDAYIFIESAFCGAVRLLTWDSDLLDADNGALNSLLNEHDLPPVPIVSPERILGYSRTGHYIETA